jgi:hypothetical protein
VTVVPIRDFTRIFAVAAVALCFGIGNASADKVGLFTSKSGKKPVKVKYTIVTPFPFNKKKEYAAVLAFPGGKQNAKAVKAVIKDYWGAEARKRGYLVFVPEAPKGYLFYRRGVFLIPDFIAHLQKKYKVKGGKVHMAGGSNGGLSAFRIALKNRKRIQSLTVFPGFPFFTRDFLRLTRLKKIKVNMFVNGGDGRWKEMMDLTHERLKKLGVNVRYKVFKAEGHKVKGLAGANSKVLFDALER